MKLKKDDIQIGTLVLYKKVETVILGIYNGVYLLACIDSDKATQLCNSGWRKGYTFSRDLSIEDYSTYVYPYKYHACSLATFTELSYLDPHYDLIYFCNKLLKEMKDAK